jgi:ABC-2 type transport system ATP-binding protein
MIPVPPPGWAPVFPPDYATETPAVLLQQLRKSYGPARGVEELTLSVPHRSIYGCLGPNGSGKTTTIRILLDLVRRDGGEVRIFGQDPALAGARLRQALGYLPGELGLPDTMTAGDALLFYAELSGGNVPLRDWACEILQLSAETLRGQLRFFSKGMKQKVGLVQAVQHAPGLLILDEPTSGLDPVIQVRLFVGLQHLRKAGVTIFFSSHILTEVQALCDRVAVLREGRLVVEGPVSQVMQTGRRALFVRRSGCHAEYAPAIAGAVPVSGRFRVTHLGEEGWWVYRTDASRTPELLAALHQMGPDDFRLESLVEESFLELYGLRPGEEPYGA